jgi:Protein of unknwon function (DUF3310)
MRFLQGSWQMFDWVCFICNKPALYKSGRKCFCDEHWNNGEPNIKGDEMPYYCTQCGKHLETGELCECREKNPPGLVQCSICKLVFCDYDIEKHNKELHKEEYVRHQPHYEQFVIQPKDFIIKNKLSWLQGSAIKYICRYQMKGGVEDLEKAKHYIDMMIDEMGEKK